MFFYNEKKLIFLPYFLHPSFCASGRLSIPRHIVYIHRARYRSPAIVQEKLRRTIATLFVFSGKLPLEYSSRGKTLTLLLTRHENNPSNLTFSSNHFLILKSELKKKMTEVPLIRITPGHEQAFSEVCEKNLKPLRKEKEMDSTQPCDYKRFHSCPSLYRFMRASADTKYVLYWIPQVKQNHTYLVLK